MSRSVPNAHTDNNSNPQVGFHNSPFGPRDDTGTRAVIENLSPLGKITIATRIHQYDKVWRVFEHRTQVDALKLLGKAQRRMKRLGPKMAREAITAISHSQVLGS
jgi:hypothetical protein